MNTLMDFIAGTILGIAAGAAVTATVCYITRGAYVAYLERALRQSTQRLAERETQLRELTAEDADWWKQINATLRNHGAGTASSPRHRYRR